jgi:hypothetical protein
MKRKKGKRMQKEMVKRNMRAGVVQQKCAFESGKKNAIGFSKPGGHKCTNVNKNGRLFEN